MSDEARRLREQQSERAITEEHLAAGAHEEEEVLEHERRAEKADYLREKLEQRLESERGD